jgi:Signal transduction histidine kinase
MFNTRASSAEHARHPRFQSALSPDLGMVHGGGRERSCATENVGCKMNALEVVVGLVRDGSYMAVTGAVRCARDVTEQERIESEWEQWLAIAERACADAQASSLSKDEFLAMLGHELRESAVRNAVVWVRLDSQSERAPSIVPRQAEQPDQRVEDLLDDNPITQGSFRRNGQRVTLVEIIEHAVEAMRFLIEDRDHALTVSLPADHVRVDGRIGLLVEQQGAEVVLRVGDSGIEISPNLLARIRPLRPVGTLARARARWARDRTRASKLRRAARPSGRGVQRAAREGAEYVVHLPVDADDGLDS